MVDAVALTAAFFLVPIDAKHGQEIAARLGAYTDALNQLVLAILANDSDIPLPYARDFLRDSFEKERKTREELRDEIGRSYYDRGLTPPAILDGPSFEHDYDTEPRGPDEPPGDTGETYHA